MQDAHDLGLVIDSFVPLVVLESHDEERALELVSRVARKRDLPVYQWTVTDGLRRSGFGLQLEQGSEYNDPEKLLEYLKTRAEVGLYVLCDFHPWLQDQPKVVRLLKDFAQRNHGNRSAVVLLSHRLQLPPELARRSARFTIALPDASQIAGLIREEASRWSKRSGGAKVRTDRETLDKLTSNLQGLTHAEVRHVVRGAIVDDGAITDADLPEVNKAKFRLMDMEGVLHYEYDTAHFSNVGGMHNLKHWLDQRQGLFRGEIENDALDAARGILLLGVQGGGKSLAARAVAGKWGLPLMRLDMGNLFNKFYGETERNLREALQLADRMSPCVLWIDEIEKGISGDSNDGGVSQRVLATLLTWMADRKSRVFMVATANDVSRLPAELIRKGRFDELFFVDLPDAQTRGEIFDIHLTRRGYQTSDFDRDALVTATEGFAGAEIEQAVVAAMYSALATDTALSGSLLLEELAGTSPISVVMAESIAQLRHWAEQRGIRRA